MGSAVYLRLAAGILALAAGAGAVVVAVELIRSVPGPTAVAAGSTSASTGSTAPASLAGGRIATPTSPGFPSPPDGALVLAREAGSRALAIALVPGTPRSLFRVSVLSPEGGGASGLAVAARFGQRRPVALPPCGAGCYQAEIPANELARSVSVTLGREAYGFVLPSLTLPPEASPIATRAEQVWRNLTSLVWHERLAGSPTEVVRSVFKAVAPDRLSYTIEGGSAAIIIGGTRWDRSTPNGRWQRSVQNPPVAQPQPFWTTAVDARVLRSTTARGQPAWVISFFDPATPGWFTATIDKSNHRTLALRMTAAAHFMQHVYGPFNASLGLRPPGT